MLRLALRRLLWTSLLATPMACGDSPSQSHDASVQRVFSLEILNPPGDSIGLNFSGTATLRVRYLDEEGQPLSGQVVNFTFLGSAGGASLSATSASTDALGIARVDIVAGAERLNFRVEVSAAKAPSVLFYIQVSDQGFSDLELISLHEGPRDAASYERLELRLYNDEDINCLDLDFDDPPLSLFAPRSQNVFGQVSQYKNLAADDDYTIIAWAEIADSRPLATGCVNLPADRLRSGSRLSATVAIIDRPLEFSEAIEVQTLIDLRPLSAGLPGEALWTSLACSRGRAQLLLDCLSDAQGADLIMDCASESTSPLGDALTLRRGVMDAEGCRTNLDPQGDVSLDALLDSALSGWPSSAEAITLAGGRQELLSEMDVLSRLYPLASGVAGHRLLSAQVGSYVEDLVQSDRPVIEADLALSLSADLRVNVPEHGFTLRYASLVGTAYEDTVLTAANVSMQGDTLGTELISGIDIAEDTGCDALENFVCTELALTPDCADQCPTIAAPLNTLLAAWLPALQSVGLDYRLSFDATLEDLDNDLGIDTITASKSAVDAQLSTESEFVAVPASINGTTPPD